MMHLYIYKAKEEELNPLGVERIRQLCGKPHFNGIETNSKHNCFTFHISSTIVSVLYIS